MAPRPPKQAFPHGSEDKANLCFLQRKAAACPPLQRKCHLTTLHSYSHGQSGALLLHVTTGHNVSPLDLEVSGQMRSHRSRMNRAAKQPAPNHAGRLEENPCLLTPSPALFASKRNLEFSLVLPHPVYLAVASASSLRPWSFLSVEGRTPATSDLRWWRQRSPKPAPRAYRSVSSLL